MTKTYTMLLILALGAPAAAELAAPELPLLDAAAVRAQLTDKTAIKAAQAWENYDTNNFPNGSQIWSLGECALAYKSTPYLGCYVTPEITIT
ncbi:MAG: hypothetical protein HY952_05005, partial [Elusimicrobia bacterium]|nr:hypothetical protein [Elusimicrobiota bacterium]